MQIYFKAPFTTHNALKLLKEYVEEALEHKILKEDELCKVELVSEKPWQALRFTCQGTTSIQSRKCIQKIFLSKDLPLDTVSTRKPFPKSLLYRKAAHSPPIVNETTVVGLLSKIES